MLKRGELPSIGGLTSFVAAAEHCSFSRAASVLNLTQGAISRQIRDIEFYLGIRLFDRIRQRVVLTEAGKVYLSHVKKALDDLSAAKQKVASFSNNGSLSLVVLPTFGSRWLIPRLSQFQNQHPGIIIHLTTRQQPVDCAIEPFDTAIFNSTHNWPGTTSCHIMDEDLLAVCSPKLKVKRAINTPADIAKFPLLHAVSTPSHWAGWMAQAGARLDGPLPGHAYQDYAMVAQAAIAGLGVALLPRYLVAESVQYKRLEIVSSGFPDVKTSYYLILPETRASSDAVQTFASWLMAEAKAYSAAA